MVVSQQRGALGTTFKKARKKTATTIRRDHRVSRAEWFRHKVHEHIVKQYSLSKGG